MDAARSLVFTNLAIALLTSIYVFAIIAICLIPEPNGKELEVASTSPTRLSVSVLSCCS